MVVQGGEGGGGSDVCALANWKCVLIIRWLQCVLIFSPTLTGTELVCPMPNYILVLSTLYT